MFKSLLIFFSLFSINQSFELKPRFNNKPDIKSFKYYGNLEPMGYFDPLSVSTNLSEDKIKYMRESELQHCRVAMGSFIFLSLLDITQDNIAINFLNDLKPENQIPYWMGVGAYEFARLGAGWENPFTNDKNKFTLVKDYQPGNVFKLDPENINEKLFNIELSNGRLAMFGCLGYIMEELVTGVPIF